MAMIVVKLAKTPQDVTDAEALLVGQGFTIDYKDSADMIGVDAVKLGGDDNAYGAGTVIVGKK